MSSTARYPQHFERDARFRPPYRLQPSDAAVLRFPYPFAEDAFSYRMNLEPHRPGPAGSPYAARFDIDEFYVAEIEDAAITLAQDPTRCQILPHMRIAAWDTLALVLPALAADYPEHFALHRDGGEWHWINRPLGIETRFRFDEDDSLPLPVFEFVARQAQGDFCLCDQRDGQLWLDGGKLTAPADWSLDFDLGMNFFEWHAPVPRQPTRGVFERALAYLLELQAEQPVRRLNWSLCASPRLDLGPETFEHWGPERYALSDAHLLEQVHLRVELQTLHRLPRSQAILFGIRVYLLSLADLARVPHWLPRLHRVLAALPAEVRDYKGIATYQAQLMKRLAALDDGRFLPLGAAPGVTQLPPRRLHRIAS